MERTHREDEGRGPEGTSDLSEATQQKAGQARSGTQGIELQRPSSHPSPHWAASGDVPAGWCLESAQGMPARAVKEAEWRWA